jgi:hypothetical protein
VSFIDLKLELDWDILANLKPNPLKNCDGRVRVINPEKAQ